MATLWSLGGNFTTAGSWAVCDANGSLDSEAVGTALGTGNSDTPTFVPAAVAIDGVAIKISSRAAGSPSNTITVKLRNTITPADVLTLTINVADLDGVTNGGWYLFKFGSTHTPNGTDTYVVRVSLSATTTAVSLYAVSANNFAKMIRTTTTQAPAAADKMYIGAEFTGAGTKNNISITMNNTASTTFGAVIGNTSNMGSINISKGGTLTWGTAAATNYLLRVAGNVTIYSGGIYNQGTVATPIPRDSTAILEFVNTAASDSGIVGNIGATIVTAGLSRTVGKDFHMTLLTADAAAAATSLTVADDTGWLSGDEIVIATTIRSSTPGTQTEVKTLNANAGASSMAFTAGLTNLHIGNVANAPEQGEVALLTRNVKIRAASSSFPFFIYTDSTTITDFEWTEFRYLGSSTASRYGILNNTTTGNLTINRCSFRDTYGVIEFMLAGCNNFTITNNVQYSNSNRTFFQFNATITGSAWTVTGNISINGAGIPFSFNNLKGVLTGNTVVASGSIGFNLIDFSVPLVLGSNLSNNVAHSTGSDGFTLRFTTEPYHVIGPLTAWRTWGIGAYFQQTGLQTGTLTIICIATTSYGLNFNISQGPSNPAGMTLKNCIFASDATYALSTGIRSDGNIFELRLIDCSFSEVTANRTAMTNDFDFNSAWQFARIVAINSYINSGTRFVNHGTYTIDGSYFSEMKRNRVAGAHQTFFFKRGTVFYEATTFHTAAPSEKLTPLSASLKLSSGPKRVAVANGATLTVNVWVRKDGTYNGNAPRLIQRANPHIGVNSDAVIDTLSVGTNTWEQLTGTTAAATDNGVAEFYVDCDGTAGNAFVDDWSLT